MEYQHDKHPLAASFARAEQLSEHLHAQHGTPAEAGWIRPSDLFALSSTQLAEWIAVTQRRLHTTAPTIIASALLQSYQWPLCASAVACYLLDRRVPDLSIDNVLVRFNATGEVDNIAYTSGCFTALSSDSAATHADAHVVADVGALHTALRTGIEAHLGAVITRLCEQLGCKPRGLWLNVADALAGNLAWLMPQHNKAATLNVIEAEVAALVRVPGSPLHSKQIGLFALTHEDHTQVYLDRATCCYWYKTEGGDYCTTCPKRTPEDRNARLLAHMAEEQATVLAK